MKTKTKNEKVPWLESNRIKELLEAWNYPVLQGGASFNRKTASGVLVSCDTPHNMNAMPRFDLYFFQPEIPMFLQSEKDRKTVKQNQKAIEMVVAKNIAQSFRDTGYRATVNKKDGYVTVRLPANYDN